MDRFEEIKRLAVGVVDDNPMDIFMITILKLKWLIAEIERLRKIEDAALLLDKYSSVDVDEWINLMGRALKENPRPSSEK